MKGYQILILALFGLLAFTSPAYGQTPYSYYSTSPSHGIYGSMGYPSTASSPSNPHSYRTPPAASSCPETSLTAQREGVPAPQTYSLYTIPTFSPMSTAYINIPYLSYYGQKAAGFMSKPACTPVKKDPVTALSAAPKSSAPKAVEPAQSEEPQLELLTYRVNRGDTLYQISRSFGVTPQLIIDLNGIANPNSLQIGQKLQIPSALGADSPNGQSIQRVMTSTLTAYTAGVESTGKSPSHPQYGITFSGKKATEGRTIAVDPKVIPLGSTVYIEGIGLRQAEDTGSAIKGTRIDVFMTDVRLARQFGVKKNVKVYVLNEGEI
jgi:3D (Asp-Asp-Asp) domain-containing protein